MAKLASISLLLLALAIVACSAEPPRYRQVRKFQQQKQRVVQLPPRLKLARQEQEAVTPYPTAEELKPEVAFVEGNQPDEVYGPPDQTYGPPEVNPLPAEQLPSEAAPEEFAPNPDAEEFQPSEVEPEQPEQPEQPSRKTNKKITRSRLIQKKQVAKAQRLVVAQPLAAPLVAAPTVTAAAPISTVPFAAPFPISSQQYFVVNQPFSYSAQYQIW